MDDLNQMTPKKIFSKIGFILSGVVIITQAVQLLLGSLLPVIFTDILYQPWYIWILTIVSLYLIAFPIYLKLMDKLPSAEIESQKTYSSGEIIILIIICLSATYIFNYVSLGINYLIGLLKGSPVVNPLELTVSSSGYIYIFVVACIIAPIVEEIMFRKVLVDKLAGYGKKTAIFVSSVAFALFHGNLSQFFYALVLGYIFAYITVVSGTIKYSATLHMVINTIGLIILPYFAMSSDINVVVAVGVVILSCIFLGIILFILKRRNLFPELKDSSINEKIPDSDYKQVKALTVLMSSGMICFMLVSAAMFLLVIFS